MTHQPEREQPEVDRPQGVHIDWAERLRQQMAAASRRRETERDLRAQLAARRDHGLAQRHATKLGRHNGHQVTDDQGPTTAEVANHIPGPTAPPAGMFVSRTLAAPTRPSTPQTVSGETATGPASGTEVEVTNPGEAMATVTVLASPDRKIRCRYMEPRVFKRRTAAVLDQCTAQAADDQGELLLCTKHLAAALALLNRRGLHVVTGTRDATEYDLDKLDLGTHIDKYLLEAHRQYTRDNPTENPS